VHYLNTPRLAWLAAATGVDFPSGLLVQGLPRGLGLAPFMAAAEKVLGHLHPLAGRLDKGSRVGAIPPGSLVSFNRRVRTKNYRPRDRTIGEGVLTGQLEKDPQIYFDLGKDRMAIPIDPQFITTNTAVSVFRSGAVTMAGLCQVKHQVPKPVGLMVVATPLVLGAEGRLVPQDESEGQE
jgi:hypothetical protein